MKRIWMASLSCSMLALAACSATEDAPSFGAETENAAPPSAVGDEKNGGMAAPGTSSGPSGGMGDGEKGGGPGGSPQAGLLTAGVWDDNLNFDFFKKYLSLSSSLVGVPSFSLQERETARAKWSQRTGASELDVAFVLDTTGSMGDELRYLQTEIDDIARTIQAKHPQMQARWGLVLYKDQFDTYVTRSFDFAPIDQFRQTLEQQSVGGGGDYPEAVEEGLEKMNSLSWRSGAVARVAFWVADAPHHVGKESAVKAQIEAAVAKDVHIYPVAASGTDDRTEYTMRTAAQLTGGRYIFLTDDSGVGNPHAEPKIPCYYVTKFNSAIVRLVESELSGARVEPDPNEILRAVGNPTNGQCATKSDGNVTIY
jgi:hypothetical protein